MGRPQGPQGGQPTYGGPNTGYNQPQGPVNQPSNQPPSNQFGSPQPTQVYSFFENSSSFVLNLYLSKCMYLPLKNELMKF